MILTLSIWAGLYLLIFLLRKKFIWEKDKLAHWFVGWGFPIIVWITGAITGWFTPFQIGAIGFAGAILLAACKELLWDKWLGFGTPSLMDFIITAVAAFCGTFLFVVPILNS